MLRGLMQVARAAVIAEPRPAGENVIGGSGGERGNIREAGKETRIVVKHGRHLRLLQHDFREPDAVGVVALPGQVVAAVAGLPGGEAVGKGGHPVVQAF